MRNIRASSLEAHPVLNLFIGDNGAGKTSILEALVVLAKGKSFRHGSATALLGPGGDAFQVSATLETDGGRRLVVGIERTADGWRARMDGRDVRQLSELSEHLPVVLMEPNSHQLVTGPPEVRRRYLDWGVFHVEQGFLATWRRYARAVKQRNAALRVRDAGLVRSLDPLLADLGADIDRLRAAQVARLAETLPDQLGRLGPGMPSVGVRYQPGWAGDSLREALERATQRDMERGSTGPGPHRAEMSLLSDDQPARQMLSRGEQKLLAAALLLSQANSIAQTGKLPVLLLDDLASEFDRRHRHAVLKASLAAGMQTWVTGTALEHIDTSAAPGFHLFHVEQGKAEPLQSPE